MKRIILAALVGVLVSGVATSTAEAISTERTDELLWLCTGKSLGDTGRLACARYIDGITDMNSMFTKLKGKSLFCIPPKGISIDQTMRIFIAWANQHPKELHKTARMSVVIAMSEAFPCKK